MNLEFVQEEKLIGSLYLDILAKNAETGELVAIENQLEWSDVDHMGRLLIYTAGCDAGVAIWVAPDFMYEHANTIHWLNEWTSKKIKLYCVKVEVVRKAGESCKEPRFRKVVFPGGWDKTATLPPVPPIPPACPEVPRLLPAPDSEVATGRLLRKTRPTLRLQGSALSLPPQSGRGIRRFPRC